RPDSALLDTRPDGAAGDLRDRLGGRVHRGVVVSPHDPTGSGTQRRPGVKMEGSFPTLRRAPWLPWYTTAAQSRALLRLIAVGIEEKLPLSPLVEAWAMDERGVQHGKLLRLAGLLGSGMSLDDAIEEVPG